MNKNQVTRKISEATDKNGQIVIDNLDRQAIAQIANSYVSGANGLLALYSKKAIAEYYELSETFVGKVIDYAIEWGIIKFSTVVRIIKNSADNERRHAQHHSLTGSEKRYAALIQKRFNRFKETFENEEKQQLYNSIFKSYLGHNTLTYVKGKFGLCDTEIIYLLFRKACIDMSDVEYDIFRKKFYDDMLGKPCYFRLTDMISQFREKMKAEIAKLQELRQKLPNNYSEYSKIRNELISEFEKIKI